jgi:hypothetical protein
MPDTTPAMTHFRRLIGGVLADPMTRFRRRQRST